MWYVVVVPKVKSLSCFLFLPKFPNSMSHTYSMFRCIYLRSRMLETEFSFCFFTQILTFARPGPGFHDKARNSMQASLVATHGTNYLSHHHSLWAVTVNRSLKLRPRARNQTQVIQYGIWPPNQYLQPLDHFRFNFEEQTRK